MRGLDGMATLLLFAVLIQRCELAGERRLDSEIITNLSYNAGFRGTPIDESIPNLCAGTLRSNKPSSGIECTPWRPRGRYPVVPSCGARELMVRRKTECDDVCTYVEIVANSDTISSLKPMHPSMIIEVVILEERRPMLTVPPRRQLPYLLRRKSLDS